MSAETSARLSFLRQGSGPALVLVHGYFGGGGHWRGQFTAFRDHFDVIAPSLAGFGDSAHLRAPDSIAGQARLVWGLLDSLGLDRIALLGHSMGGMVVQEMTAQQPGRVARLALYGTGPVGVLPGRFETIATSRQRLAADGVAATMRRIVATWFVDGAAAPGYAACEAEGLKATAQAAAASLTAWEGWDGTAALPGIAAPTLILWGEHDRSYNRSQPEALLRGVPGARLEVLPGCAHAAHLERPDLFNRLLGDFLAGWGSGG